MVKLTIKSESTLNYILFKGIRYHQPKESKLCCWDNVRLLSYDTKNNYPKWIIIDNEFGMERWLIQ